jgi:hypothetical protein
MMTRQRGRGRSKGPELRGTLGTLLRTTLAQAGAVREVLERGAREGRARWGEARSERRRDTALADLGELVIELIDRGDAPELADHPDVLAALEAIAELEVDDDDRGHDRRPVAGRDYVAPPTRSRFDRGVPAERDRAASGRGRPARDDADDGAVSSGSWRPPAPGRPSAGVWRPPRDRSEPANPEPARTARREPTAEPGARFQVKDRGARPGAARGGIQFDDDSDLADYMNPDDVPGPDKK